MKKNNYSRLWFSYFVFISVMLILQIGLTWLISSFLPELSASSYNVHIILVVVDILALPVLLLMFRAMRTPAVQSESQPMGIGTLIFLYITCVGTCYIFSIIGNLICMVLGELLNVTFINPVAQLIDGTPIWVTILSVVIIAPLFEELVFRKLLLSRTGGLSQRSAALMSALAFALFHMQLSQFFYAFAVGYILAIVYLRTKRLLYCFLLHAAVNLTNSLILPNMIQQSNQVLILVGGLLIFLAIGFAIFYIIKKRSMFFPKPQPEEILPEIKKNTYLNIGFALFAVLCVAITVLSVLIV